MRADPPVSVQSSTRLSSTESTERCNQVKLFGLQYSRIADAALDSMHPGESQTQKVGAHIPQLVRVHKLHTSCSRCWGLQQAKHMLERGLSPSVDIIIRGVTCQQGLLVKQRQSKAVAVPSRETGEC